MCIVLLFCIFLVCEGQITQFHTAIKEHEYIVLFHKFYSQATRERYLRAALNRLNASEWATIIERNNAASRYPSDFDILRVTQLDITPAIKHPAIKNITPHRTVQRFMKAHDNDSVIDEWIFAGGTRRKLLRQIPEAITASVEASKLWDFGITGYGVKVAVFDTGLSRDHPHFRRVKERTNWTNEKSLDDGVSHGTFVAGVIASKSRECFGLAPDAELHIYRVFTNTQISYTSWFLDAFNYAIFKKINVLNLSIGGPDFLDKPFVDKVLELSANKVIMISAIGNDGPLYGTLNNPGDQSDVIGVGGITDNRVAKFSSRGMTTWELPAGYGRLKPDIVTYGSQVKGSDVHFGCRSLSGTSVASPVVAGATALIISGALNKIKFINPSSIKQILIEGASRLPGNNMFEQGHGKLNIVNSMRLLLSYSPKVSLSPAYLDFTESYMWPYNSQPLFYGSSPTIVNVTILNAISVSGKITKPPTWHVYGEQNKHILSVAITYSPVLWPWSGWMAVYMKVNENGNNFEGTVRGHITLIVQNPSDTDIDDVEIESIVHFPIKVQIIPRPPRHKRILWDQYHNLRYPPGYIPRDNLKVKQDPLDWRADHIHTNFRDMYSHLRNAGYYIDVLSMPYTCFNASNYGTLIAVDTEREFHKEEITKIENDVYEHGLSIIVFADWYNVTVMKKIKFFDENTRQWWIPDTGGANVPAINDLLSVFGIAFGDIVAEGYYKLGDHTMYCASGTTIVRFPKMLDNIVIGANLIDQGAEIINSTIGRGKERAKEFLPILGLMQAKSVHRSNDDGALRDSYAHLFSHEDADDQSDFNAAEAPERNPMRRNLLKFEQLKNNYKLDDLHGKAKYNNKQQHSSKAKMPILTEGRVAVFGDSNCLDSAHLDKACFWLLDALLEFTMNSHINSLLTNLNSIKNFESIDSDKILPLRLSSSNLNSQLRQQTIEACSSPHWITEIFVVNTAENEQPIPKQIFQQDPEKSILSEINEKYKLQLANNGGLRPDDKLDSVKDFNKVSLLWVCILSFVVLILIIFSFRKRHLWRLRRSIHMLADI